MESAVRIPLSVINPNAHFSIDQHSSSGTSENSNQEAANAQGQNIQVEADLLGLGPSNRPSALLEEVDSEDVPFVLRETGVNLIPNYLPELPTIMCHNGDQLLAALLIQRCQLMLWLAESKEKTAVYSQNVHAVTDLVVLKS